MRGLRRVFRPLNKDFNSLVARDEGKSMVGCELCVNPQVDGDSPRTEPQHGEISGVYFYSGQGILVDSLMFASRTILLVSKMTGPKRFPPTLEEDTPALRRNL